MSVATILLAAGGSRRLGRAKQLLPFRGSTLIAHAATTALAACGRPVIVVLGAAAEECGAALRDIPALHVVRNEGWSDGMAGSIRVGLAELRRLEPKCAGAIFMVCDQPGVDAAHLEALCETAAREGKGIAASAYEGALGVPAFFAARYFPELLGLSGDTGARSLIVRHADDVSAAPLLGGNLDVDTPEDYRRAVSDD